MNAVNGESDLARVLVELGIKVSVCVCVCVCVCACALFASLPPFFPLTLALSPISFLILSPSLLNNIAYNFKLMERSL